MKHTLLILFIFVSYFLNAQEYNTFGGEEYAKKEYVFVMRLMPDMSSNLYQLGIMKIDNDGKTEVIYLSADSWIRQLIGIESSKANPDAENFVIKHKIFDFSNQSVNNEEIEHYTIEKVKQLLDNLWRLKYSEYPWYSLEKKDEKGWALNPDPEITWMPSESQTNILRGYGVTEINEFFKDDDLFRLLRDIHDTEWQNRYIQSAGVYNTQP
jgi:hypothetical protein